jgi:hypothetical protein
MHTSTAVSPARRQSPPRVPRTRKAPAAPARVFGFKHDQADQFDAIYYGSTSVFGELGDSVWCRDRANHSPYSKDVWYLKVLVCGQRIYLDAVIDDFGDLVAVDR